VCGVASLCVWFLGPLVGLGVAWRVLIIGLILLAWPLAFFLQRARRPAQTEATAPPNPQPAPPAGKPHGTPQRALEELTRNAEEAVQWLRRARPLGSKPRQAVYALPWFLVAGPPASGKTSLLLASGLGVHTLPRQRSVDLDSVRPTRHCEWRVTDAAVFLDTAGRYQNEGPAQREWAALAEIIKQQRKARPLDGVLVTVSAEKLLSLGEGEIEQQAKILRTRLDELGACVNLRLPVYLVFTHADALTGFREFFDAPGRDISAEVWGTTIPLAKSAQAQALFDSEFDQLYEALVRQRLLRLGALAAPDGQLRVFDFPYMFNDARHKLGLFTSTLFRPNPFSESPLLRGFYFTGLVRGEDGAAARQPGGANGDGAGANGNSMTGSAPTAFFTHRLFKEVLLADKDLAAAFQASRRRPTLKSVSLLGAAVVAALLLCAALLFSYFQNRALVADALAAGARLNALARPNAGSEMARPAPEQARAELEAIAALHDTLRQLDEAGGKPLYREFGLFTGNTIQPALRVIYFDAIERRFKKPAVAALERDLRAFAAAPQAGGGAPTASAQSPLTEAEEEELGRKYDLLKAYLMLAQPERVEPVFLVNELAVYWKKSAPPEMELIAQQQLEFFADELDVADAPHIKADDALVAGARRRLAAYPAVNRFYKRLITDTNARTKAVTLDSILEGRGRGALTSTYTVPGSYTIEGYREHMRGALALAAAEMGKEDWVMGAQPSASQNAVADAGKLRSMYFRDYADQWRNFMRGVSVREYRTKADGTEVLAQLSSTDSPLERVLLAVTHHTNFSAPAPSGGFWNWLTSFFARAPTADTGGNSEPEKEFRPLFAFVAAPEGKKDGAPVAQYRATLAAVLDPLAGASQTQLDQTAQALLTGRDDLGLQKAEQNLSALLDPFKQTAAGGEAAALLKQPLDNLRALLYGSGYAQIQKTWREQIYPKARALEVGFPFTSTGETALADLVRFINPENGQFTAFFNAQLATSFDDVEGQWVLKESGTYKFSKDFVKYVNDVRQLREALFPNGGAQPEVAYTLEVPPVSDANITILIDGQLLKSADKKPARFVWPARGGAAAGAALQIKAKGGEEKQPLGFAGEWGLFRLLAAGSTGKSDAGALAVTWQVDAVPVRATLRPEGVNHPFQLNLFSKLRAPRGL
jgi:type VI secretion system protein ImpL